MKLLSNYQIVGLLSYVWGAILSSYFNLKLGDAFFGSALILSLVLGTMLLRGTE